MLSSKKADIDTAMQVMSTLNVKKDVTDYQGHMISFLKESNPLALLNHRQE